MSETHTTVTASRWSPSLRSPIGIAALSATAIAAGAWLAFGGWRWLPLPLAVLTVGLLAECVSTDKPTLSAKMSILTAAMIVGLLASVTAVTDGLTGKPSAGQGTTEVALGISATTTPEVAVEGATLTREDFERLNTCEQALNAIAAAVQTAPESAAPYRAPDEVVAVNADAAGRLRSCEVRLSAIALSLEP